MAINLVNVIFGMKLRQARQEKGLSLSAFAEKCELSASYLTEIEKGRKYPRNDKILRMAQALGKGYDELVSVRLDPSLSHFETALSSSMLRGFPFEEFGLEAGDLVQLLTRMPDKSSALIHALLSLGRHYDLNGADFLRAALRSYQELHDNHFEELETAAQACGRRLSSGTEVRPRGPLSREKLERFLRTEYGYRIDTTQLDRHPVLHTCRTAFVDGDRPQLLVNARLSSRQMRFVLAREIGYQFLGLRERSPTSTPLGIDSFQQILNDTKAAYFAGALLVPRARLIRDLGEFFGLPGWDPACLERMVERHQITPAVLLYRCGEVVPTHYGFKTHLLRIHRRGERYDVGRQLHLDGRMAPSGMGLHEHLCRRWLPLRLLGESGPARTCPPLRSPAGAQISELLPDRGRFLHIGFVRPGRLAGEVDSCLTIGLELSEDIRAVIQFVDDPAIPFRLVHETCERCPLTASQCTDRVAEPSVFRSNRASDQRREALTKLTDRLCGRTAKPQPPIA